MLPSTKVFARFVLELVKTDIHLKRVYLLPKGVSGGFYNADKMADVATVSSRVATVFVSFRFQRMLISYRQK